jgi:hypothetical protein
MFCEQGAKEMSFGINYYADKSQEHKTYGFLPFGNCISIEEYIYMKKKKPRKVFHFRSWSRGDVLTPI